MITKLNEYLGHKEEIIYKVVNKLGYKIKSKLGGGYYGYAYLIDDDKVLKISYNSSDIKAGDKLIGKKCEYLANYYDIYQTNEFGIIVMEKLDTKNVNRDKLQKAMDTYDHYLNDNKLTMNYHNTKV